MNEKVLNSLKGASDLCPDLQTLFATDPDRASWLTTEACGIHADFSRQHLNHELFEMFIHFAEQLGVSEKFSQMFSGEKINVTENRSVMHVALRDSLQSTAFAQDANKQLDKALVLATSVRNGKLLNSTGSVFKTVVNIGIGGSDLGPAMATKALRNFCDGPTIKFVSNVDSADLDDALQGLDPATTLFVIASKTFTTSETMLNAERARRWVQNDIANWSQHFVATTARAETARAWGIQPEQILEFFDWVGGRFSLSSVIGFPLMCAIGEKRFSELLRGMESMDQHVATSELAQNIAVMHAITWIANTLLYKRDAVAVIPYSHDLARFPAFLQQLLMESNGKSVQVDGSQVVGPASPVVFGEPGTNGQHAFFQMLHQGVSVIPVEFICAVQPLGSDAVAHDVLVANMIAQSQALAAGQDLKSSEMNQHRVFPGNRPSTILFLDSLNPRTLGALVAMYEHSTAVQGWLMNINSFDQWGVELGKSLALTVFDKINQKQLGEGLETMTHPLLKWYVEQRALFNA